MNLTRKERTVLVALANSDYLPVNGKRQVVGCPTWLFDVELKSGLPIASFGGVVASLRRKGMVTTRPAEKNGVLTRHPATITMQAAGYAAVDWSKEKVL